MKDSRNTFPVPFSPRSGTGAVRGDITVPRTDRPAAPFLGFPGKSVQPLGLVAPGRGAIPQSVPSTVPSADPSSWLMPAPPYTGRCPSVPLRMLHGPSRGLSRVWAWLAVRHRGLKPHCSTQPYLPLLVTIDSLVSFLLL